MITHLVSSQKEILLFELDLTLGYASAMRSAACCAAAMFHKQKDMECLPQNEPPPIAFPMY
jgi:hypothetical protein